MPNTTQETIKSDLLKIELDDRREAALNAALAIVCHAKEKDGYLSGETITQIIMEKFAAFHK